MVICGAVTLMNDEMVPRFSLLEGRHNFYVTIHLFSSAEV